jgi:hypothetical protein
VEHVVEAVQVSQVDVHIVATRIGSQHPGRGGKAVRVRLDAVLDRASVVRLQVDPGAGGRIVPAIECLHLDLELIAHGGRVRQRGEHREPCRFGRARLHAHLFLQVQAPLADLIFRTCSPGSLPRVQSVRPRPSWSVSVVVEETLPAEGVQVI